MTAWHRWHQGYRDPGSPLSQRLAVVTSCIRAWADTAPPGPLRLISICAGQADDVSGALGDHPRRDDLTGLLVEADQQNVATARRRLGAAGLRGISAVL